MTTSREIVRARHNKVFVRAKEQGIDLSEERRRYGGNTRALSFAAKKLINAGTPRQDADVLTIDNPPPIGVFDGGNKTFGLSGEVAGQQVCVIWGDTAGNRTIVLERSSNNPPPVEGYFFSFDNPSTIVVGSAPVVADALIVVYKSRG